jgi:hypothetical protein
MDGKQALLKEVNNAENEIDISALPQGIYIVDPY